MAKDDALKRVLNVLHLKAKLFYQLEFAEPWGVRFAINSSGADFHVIEGGRCWLRLPGTAEPTLLLPGDLVVIANQDQYELVDDLATIATPLHEWLHVRKAQPASPASTTTTHLICGEFRAENNMIYPLFSLLPPLIIIRGVEGKSVEWLSTSLQFIASEAHHKRPGNDTVISRLMDILFIMVIRYWIDQHVVGEGGWLGALYHPQIGEVLGLIHQQPEHHWTVEALAAAVKMARSTLAGQFTVMVGEPPMRYLTRWRMQVAAMLLMEDRMLTIEAIAQRTGYASAYAFSKAFKRWTGLAPSIYRRQSAES